MGRERCVHFPPQTRPFPAAERPSAPTTGLMQAIVDPAQTMEGTVREEDFHTSMLSTGRGASTIWATVA